MKKPFLLLTIAALLAIAITSCDKRTNFKPKAPDDYELREEFVTLPVDDSFRNNKSLDERNYLTEQFNFPLNDKQGIIEISLDEEAKLITARITKNIYYDLLNRVGVEKVNSLPQELINQSILMKKLGFDYWGNSNFLPPMSKEEFDKRFNKCTNKPTELGVLLCTMNLITTAISDCLQASAFTKSVHCW